jgi:hypothetical protein
MFRPHWVIFRSHYTARIVVRTLNYVVFLWCSLHLAKNPGLIFSDSQQKWRWIAQACKLIGCGLDDEILIPSWIRDFSFLYHDRLWGTTHLLSMGTRTEADHSSPSNAEVKIHRSLPPPVIMLYGMVLMHRDNFTITYLRWKYCHAIEWL